ncbi:MAG: hypothetical protein ACC662_00875 [Planctomycetota bacterium]
MVPPALLPPPLSPVLAAYRPLDLLAGVVLALVVFAGVGSLLLVLRVIFPRPAAAADRALARLSTGRLLLTGFLPLIGAVLLGMAIGRAGPFVGGVYAVLVLLPLFLLALLGAVAAVPYLGRAVLRPLGEAPPLLVAALLGAIVLGLAGAAVALAGREAGIVLFSILVGGWFLGAGLGTVLGPRTPPEAAGVDP